MPSKKVVKPEPVPFGRLAPDQREQVIGYLDQAVAYGEKDARKLAHNLLNGVLPFPVVMSPQRVQRLCKDRFGVTVFTSDVRTSSAPLPPEQVIEQRDLKAEAAELRKLTADAAKSDQMRRLLTEHLGTWRPTPYNPPSGLHEDRADHLWVLNISDWHIGQETSKDSTGGLFEQNTGMARAQVQLLLQVLREILRDGGREVRKLLVILNGDIVEGDDMRNSQHTGIDLLVMQQTVEAFDLLRWFLDGLLELFPEVVVSSVGGNHDRTSRKPGSAGGGELGYVDSHAWLIGEMLTRWYSQTEPTRMKVINWPTYYGRLVFGGHRFVHSHGADIKWSTGGHSGIPWNAISVAAGKYDQMVGGFDALFLGHGHIEAKLPLGRQSHVFLNGALPPSTDYIQSSFKAERRPVQQLSMWNKHGMVAYYPVYLEVGNRVSSAELWADTPNAE